jgi:hypothetical protein
MIRNFHFLSFNQIFNLLRVSASLRDTILLSDQ